MTPQITRRDLMSASVLAAIATGAVGCTPDEPVPTPSPPPSTPPPAPSPRGMPTAQPSPTSSYGPNGTHFPQELPWPGDLAAVELTATCDWDDIARQIHNLSADQVALGVVVRVEPGSLPGGGSTSSAPPVLENIGDETWTRNVLIVPRDGFGSVTLALPGARFEQCARLSFFGFESPAGFVLTHCVGLQMGWSRFDTANITRGGRDLAYYELVAGFRRDPEDTASARPTETFEMTNISRHGCAFGPSVKPDRDSAHCDTIQLEGTGAGPFGPFISVDCVDYGSSNAAILLHDRLSRAEFRHCMVLAGELSWQVYPLQDGDYRGEPNAFSGGCRDVRVYDSVVAGAIGRMGFTEVLSSRLSYAPVQSQQPSESGAWTPDPGILEWDRADIMARMAIPDYERETLRTLWTW